MTGSDALKKLQTNIKSAQGIVILTVILNLIYIAKSFISNSLHFWFSTYLTEFMMKSSSFVPDYQGSFPKAGAIALIVLEVLALLVPTLLSNKNGKLLFVSFGVYVFDSIFMIVGSILNPFGDFAEDSIIGFVLHLFVLVFLIAGIVSYKKIKTLEFDPTETEE